MNSCVSAGAHRYCFKPHQYERRSQKDHHLLRTVRLLSHVTLLLLNTHDACRFFVFRNANPYSNDRTNRSTRTDPASPPTALSHNYTFTLHLPSLIIRFSSSSSPIPSRITSHCLLRYARKSPLIIPSFIGLSTFLFPRGQ